MHGSILIENISFVILKQQNAKSIMDSSIWVKFISKNGNTLEIEHSLPNSPIIIPCYGFHFRSTDLPKGAFTNRSRGPVRRVKTTI